MVSIYQALANLEESGGTGALCTIIACQGSTPRTVGSKMLVYPEGSFVGTIGGGEMESRVLTAAAVVLKSGQPQTLEYSMTDPRRGDPGVCGGQIKIFVEPIQPKPLVVVVGTGHVGKEVVHLAKWLGFRVAVADDRPEFCSPEAVPEADAFFPGPLDDLSDRVEFAPQSYFVLTTRSVDVDMAVLPGLLTTAATYIGVIGSRRRWATTQSKLVDLGVPQEKIAMVHSPIGLRLNAETPREIAVSILAEIMMLQKNGGGKPRADHT